MSYILEFILYDCIDCNFIVKHCRGSDSEVCLTHTLCPFCRTNIAHAENGTIKSFKRHLQKKLAKSDDTAFEEVMAFVNVISAVK